MISFWKGLDKRFNYVNYVILFLYRPTMPYNMNIKINVI